MKKEWRKKSVFYGCVNRKTSFTECRDNSNFKLCSYLLMQRLFFLISQKSSEKKISVYFDRKDQDSAFLRKIKQINEVLFIEGEQLEGALSNASRTQARHKVQCFNSESEFWLVRRCSAASLRVCAISRICFVFL